MIQVQQASRVKKVAALVYGRPGTGKTTLATREAPSPLVIDFFERSWEVLEGVPYVEATPSNLEEVLRWLAQSPEAKQYETIIVDSLTMLQVLLSDRPMTQQDWGQASQAINGLVLHLTYKLPHQPNVIFIAHEKIEDESPTSYYVPALMPSVTRTLTASMSLIGRTELSLEKKVESGRVRESRVYWLGLQGSTYMAKVRNSSGEWPPRVASPTFRALRELLGLKE